jgi:hypothetical protein
LQRELPSPRLIGALVVLDLLLVALQSLTAALAHGARHQHT